MTSPAITLKACVAVTGEGAQVVGTGGVLAVAVMEGSGRDPLLLTLIHICGQHQWANTAQYIG